MRFSTIIILLFSVVLPIWSPAQGETSQSGFFYSDLKIYVVVAVLLIILLGLIIHLFSIEKRLKKLENQQ